MVPLQMELGGKDVCIVCADADLQLAAKNIVKGGFSYRWAGAEGRSGRARQRAPALPASNAASLSTAA